VYLCRLYTVYTWICKNIVALLGHVEYGMTLQSYKKLYMFYIQVTSEVMRGALALWLRGSSVKMCVIILVIYKESSDIVAYTLLQKTV
jgi:hypothetical protein